jgi:hypothetical protein
MIVIAHGTIAIFGFIKKVCLFKPQFFTWTKIMFYSTAAKPFDWLSLRLAG